MDIAPLSSDGTTQIGMDIAPLSSDETTQIGMDIGIAPMETFLLYWDDLIGGKGYEITDLYWVDLIENGYLTFVLYWDDPDGNKF